MGSSSYQPGVEVEVEFEVEEVIASEILSASLICPLPGTYLD